VQAGAGQRREGGSWRLKKDGESEGEDAAAPVTVRRTVYVLVNGAAVPREVTTGLTDGRVTEITGGELKQGEAVIVGIAGQNNGQGQRGGQQQRGPRIL